MSQQFFFVVSGDGEFARIGGATDPFPLFQQRQSALTLARDLSEMFRPQKYHVCQTIAVAEAGAIDWCRDGDTDRDAA